MEQPSFITTGFIDSYQRIWISTGVGVQRNINQHWQAGAGICSNPFTLPSKGSSCTLSLQVNGSQLTHPITDGPIVCEQGSTLQCYKPSPSNV